MIATRRELLTGATATAVLVPVPTAPLAPAARGEIGVLFQLYTEAHGTMLAALAHDNAVYATEGFGRAYDASLAVSEGLVVRECGIVRTIARTPAWDIRGVAIKVLLAHRHYGRIDGEEPADLAEHLIANTHRDLDRLI